MNLLTVTDVSAWTDHYCATVNFTARFNINKFGSFFSSFCSFGKWVNYFGFLDEYPKRRYVLSSANKSNVIGGECGNDLSKIDIEWFDASSVGHINITFQHFRDDEYYKLIEMAFKLPVAMLGINENKELDLYCYSAPRTMSMIATGQAFNNQSLTFTLPLTNVHGNVSLGMLHLSNVYIKAQSVCEFQTFCELDLTSSCKLFELGIPLLSKFIQPYFHFQTLC